MFLQPLIFLLAIVIYVKCVARATKPVSIVHHILFIEIQFNKLAEKFWRESFLHQVVKNGNFNKKFWLVKSLFLWLVDRMSKW